ncbi:type VII secretion protein EccB [Catenuloplanes sp. NPDC051500]|uniref:type VII secretion protein EccB n=1 Tax=Catenuloplanes sp. NPDC051500 TaxID=3363959 RepID=UPI0037B5F5A1
MQSRRDQAQAQSYLTGRLASALVAAEPDALETPHRRTMTGLLTGVLVAALVVGGFTLYGFLVPGGSTRWRTPGTLVVEKETGSRYLLVDGRLRPILNYSSALLLLGAAPSVVQVSAKSLRGVPHGQPLGIVGAPDTLPAGGFDGTRWSVCATGARDLAGAALTATTLAVGHGPAGEAGVALGDGQAIVARVAGDTVRHLVWAGRRFRMTETWTPAVLGYEAEPVAVSAAWLDLLPAGPDLGPIDVPGRGEPGPRVDGRVTRIGQLFAVSAAGAEDRYYLLRREGLARLTATGYALLLGDPATAAAYTGAPVTALPLSPAALTPTALTDAAVLPDGLPSAPPPAVTGPNWCVVAVPGAAPAVEVQPPLGAGDVVRPGLGTTRNDHTADAVAIGPGLGGLARGGRAGAEPSGTYYLVTDAGVKYPIANAEAVKTLGYDPQNPSVLDPALLGLLPTGPALDPATARGNA